MSWAPRPLHEDSNLIKVRRRDGRRQLSLQARKVTSHGHCARVLSPSLVAFSPTLLSSFLPLLEAAVLAHRREVLHPCLCLLKARGPPRPLMAPSHPTAPASVWTSRGVTGSLQPAGSRARWVQRAGRWRGVSPHPSLVCIILAHRQSYLRV